MARVRRKWQLRDGCVLARHSVVHVMVSVGVSALGRTSIHFVEHGVKVNGQYYRDTLLLEGLLPEIRELSEYFIFQQDSAPAHQARETVELLEAETPDFIPQTLWPPNSPNLSPVRVSVVSDATEGVPTSNQRR